MTTRIRSKVVLDGSLKPEDMIPNARFEWNGAWNNGTPYQIGDVVTKDGATYRALADNTNDAPPSASWALFSGPTPLRQAELEWYGPLPPSPAVGDKVYVPLILGAAMTFDIQRTILRLETAGSTATTVAIQSSPGGGAFVASAVDTLTLAAGQNQIDHTSGFAASSVVSGQILRINWAALGTGAADFQVYLIAREH